MPRFSGTHRRITGFGMMAEVFQRAARVGVPEAISGAIENIGEEVAQRARSYLGYPQYEGHGGFPPWAPLAPSTLARKAENTPLVETGELKGSIEHVRKSESEVEIGTNVPYGKYLEYGTRKMPPRPFLEPAALEVTEDQLPVIGRAVVKGIDGGGEY